MRVQTRSHAIARSDAESESARRDRRRLDVSKIVAFVVLAVGSAFMVFPFLWMLLGSFKTAEELSRPVPTFLPESPSFDNYATLFATLPFATYFVNSLVVTGITVTCILFTSSLMGYIFARGGFRGQRVLFVLILVAMIIPFEVIVVPLYLVVANLGWTDTYQALIVPFVIDAFGIYLFREFMAGIPKDYFDAGRIDGASEWRMYRSIALPQCGPVIATLAIFSFVYIWDQLIWPIVVISSDRMKTLPVGIASLSTETGARFDLVLAAAVLAVLPPLIFFLFFQRRIVQGATLAGLKG